MNSAALRYGLAALLGLYLAAIPLLSYRYRVHQRTCPCHLRAQ